MSPRALLRNGCNLLFPACSGHMLATPRIGRHIERDSMQRWQRDVLCAAVTAGCGAAAGAAELSQEEELAMAFGDKSFVSIATGSRVPVARAPAIATVITAEDIKALGATDLDEVLETVPGLHVSVSPINWSPIYTIRGVRGTLTNPQVLMLVNGVPVTSIYAGDRGLVWGGMPIENIARIEVIRGPGSALHGADAFAGVINLITKSAADIAGTQFSLRAGSFGSGSAAVLHGGTLGPASVAAYFGVGSTQGQRETVSADAQTGLDTIFGAFGVPPVSRAPGPVSTGHDAVDAGLDLGVDKWRLRMAYKGRTDVGSGAGVAQALDPTGRAASHRFTSDLGWHDANFAPNWDVSLQASFMSYSERSDLVLFPAGSNLGGGFFADGMIGNPYKWERHGRLDASAVFTGFERHRLRLGAGYAKQDLYKIRETKNFNPDFSPIGSGSLADLTDVSDTLPFIRPHSRTLRYLVAQDEWNFSKDWTLTAGVRHDRFSDFGGTTNPRVAIVWDAAYNVTAKLLYGNAYRAPSFTELYLINNPTAIGNPDLHPEKIRTLEGALSWQPVARLRTGLNLFHYRMSDIIRLDNTLTYQNSGSQRGNGLELEVNWDAGKDVQLSGSYSQQRSQEQSTGQDAGLAPHQRIHLRADWRVARGWHANAQLHHVADRRREPGDPRPPVPDYTTLDFSLRSAPSGSAWQLALRVRNLFDADAREPSPFGQPFVSIPNDLPLAGRAIQLQLSYRL